MARLKLEDVKIEVAKKGWELLSPSYTNLRTDLQFECPERHLVVTSLGEWRSKQECPVCEHNPMKNIDVTAVAKKTGVTRRLALDQSTGNSGYSVYDDGELIAYGAFEAQEYTDEGFFFRSLAVSEWLLSLIAKWEPDMVAVEEIQYQPNVTNSVIVFKRLAALQGILVNTVLSVDLPISIVPVSTWRHFCGVKGKNRVERKKNAQRFVKEKYDVTVSTDEADAICIGAYVAGEKIKGYSPIVMEFGGR